MEHAMSAMSQLQFVPRLTIGVRLNAGFALVAAVLAVAVGTTIWTVANLSSAVDRMTGLRVPVAITSTEMVGDLVSTLATLRGYLLTGNEQTKAERAAAWKNLDETAASFDKMAERFTNPENTRKWSEAKGLLQEFHAAQDKAEAVAFTDDAFPATKLLVTQAAPLVGKMFAEITKMINEEESLEATPERKQLLKNMADVRGNLAASAAQLRMFLLSGDKTSKDEFLRVSDVFKVAIESLRSKQALLTPSQAISFAAVLEAREEFEPLPAQIIAVRESPSWNVPVHTLTTEAAPRAGKILDLMLGVKQADGKRVGGLKDNQQKMLAQDTQEVVSGMSFLSTLQWILLAAGLVGAGLIAFFTKGSIVPPIRQMTATMGAMARGDMSVEIPGVGRSDEIGEMAESVKVFKDGMVEAERLRSERVQLEHRAAEHRKADMHRLADSFQRAVGGIVDTVSSASSQLESAATSLTSTAASTQELSGAVAAASEQTSANVQGVAAASEQLSSTVNEISRQVQESSSIANQAVSQAARTNDRVNELSQSADRIGDVIGLINTIAGQTNLLALNATIEAARAGDAGKGFAVVAQEVKALAAQTAKATSEIATQISSMQSATSEAVGAIKEITGTINKISEISGAIAAAVEEQGATTKEISRNVTEAAKGTAEVASNITAVSRGAGETGSASSQVLTSAKALSGESNQLKSEVEKFLATVRAA
jgi:methyl-accepting chemotaxis protein